MIRRLNHAVLYVADARRSAAFYGDVLGFTTVQDDMGGRAVFMRAANSDNHHDLGLFSIGAASVNDGDDFRARVARPGLYHLAWQVDTIDELVAMRDRLAAAGALVGASDHGSSKSLYGVDPDGIEFEIMWMVPRTDWGRYEAEAVVAPLDLAAEQKRWSGVETRV